MEKPKNHTIVHSFVMVLTIVLMGIFINNLVFATKDFWKNTVIMKEKKTIIKLGDKNEWVYFSKKIKRGKAK